MPPTHGQTPHKFVNVQTHHASLWLDGLYVRETTRGRLSWLEWALLSASTGNDDHGLWMTKITLQGNGASQHACTVCGLWLSAQVYAEGALLSMNGTGFAVM